MMCLLVMRTLEHCNTESVFRASLRILNRKPP